MLLGYINRNKNQSKENKKIAGWERRETKLRALLRLFENTPKKDTEVEEL